MVIYLLPLSRIILYHSVMIKVVVEITKTGFSGYAEKYAAFTTSKNWDELQCNMVESLNLLFKAKRIQQVVTIHDIKFEFDIKSIFRAYPVINVRALAARLKINHTLMAQYAIGKKKPSDKRIGVILNEIRAIGKELSKINLVVK